MRQRQAQLAIEHFAIELRLLAVEIVTLRKYITGLTHSLDHFRQEQALKLLGHFLKRRFFVGPGLGLQRVQTAKIGINLSFLETGILHHAPP